MLLLIIIRLAWRWEHPAPALPDHILVAHWWERWRAGSGCEDARGGAAQDDRWISDIYRSVIDDHRCARLFHCRYFGIHAQEHRWTARLSLCGRRGLLGRAFASALPCS